jgi:hypothetical protein
LAAADPLAVGVSERRITPMTDDNNTAIDAIQIDEDVLSYAVSDEALEAAAGTEKAGTAYTALPLLSYACCR